MLLEKWFRSEAQQEIRVQLKQASDNVEHLLTRLKSYEDRLVILRSAVKDLVFHIQQYETSQNISTTPSPRHNNNKNNNSSNSNNIEELTNQDNDGNNNNREKNLIPSNDDNLERNRDEVSVSSSMIFELLFSFFHLLIHSFFIN